MEEALDSYQQARQECLENEATNLGSDGRHKLHEFNSAADLLITGAQELTGPDIISTLKAAHSSHPKAFELLDEHVCITFGWEAMGMLSVARSRFLELLLLLKERELTNPAKAFLQRVARCYVFGFDAECVVMCRAVLDRVFETEVSGDDVENWWTSDKMASESKKNRRQQAPHNLWGRIQTARYTRRLTELEREAADSIREARQRWGS